MVGGDIWEIDTCGEGAGLVEGKCLHDALIQEIFY